MLEIGLGVLAVTWPILGFMCGYALQVQKKRDVRFYLITCTLIALGLLSFFIVWRYGRRGSLPS